MTIQQSTTFESSDDHRALFERTEALLQQSVLDSIDRAQAESPGSDKVANALRDATKRFWANYKVANEKRGQFDMAGGEELHYLNRLQRLKNMLTRIQHGLISEFGDDYWFTSNLESLAYEAHNPNSNANHQPLIPEAPQLLQGMVSDLCGALRIDGTEVVSNAIAETQSTTVDDGISNIETDIDGFIHELKLGPDDAGSVRSAVSTYIHTVRAIQNRSESAFALQIKAASPSYYEAFIKGRPPSRLRDSGANIHAVGWGNAALERAIVAYYTNNHDEFDREVYDTFSKENERALTEKLGAFVIPLRQSLDMFCGHAGIDPAAIVARRSKAERSDESSSSPYVDRLSQAARIDVKDIVR